jgi:methylated-DNA-protein-cysteine methyltransferase-like protein
VTVTTGNLGELMVDFAEYGWSVELGKRSILIADPRDNRFPRQLPSEEAAGIAPPIDSDDEG